MLQLRICPKCGAEIKSKTALFCYACGEELEPPKASVSIPEKSVAEPKPPEEKISFTVPAFLFTITKTIGLLLLILFVLGAIGGGVYYYFRNRTSELQTKSQNQAFIEESFVSLETLPLGRGVLAELTPTEISVYIEGTKPEEVLPKIFGDQFEQDFEGQADLTLSEAASFLEDQFALVGQQEATASSRAAFISKARDVDFVEKRLEELPTEEASVSAVLVEDYLVISNSQALTEEIERAFRKLSLSLALTTDYAESLRHLPEEGQLLIYFASRDNEGSSSLKEIYGWIPENLTGNGFMIVEENGKSKVIGESKIKYQNAK